jgi:hypothetical protein
MTTTTLAVGKPGWFSQRGAYDWLYALCIVLGAGYAFQRYGSSMDVYERGILLGAVPSLIGLGWFWGPLRTLSLGVGRPPAGHLALQPAPGQLRRRPGGRRQGLPAEVLPGQPERHHVDERALLHEHPVLLDRLLHPPGRRERAGPEGGLRPGLGRRVHGADRHHGALVRSHQIGPDIGHIPVSNLYEVFVLFCWLTTLFYLYYEAHYKIRSLGLRDAGGQRRGGLPALVHPGARRAGDPAAGAGPAELVDEAARAGQLHRLRHLRAGRHGGPGLPAQGVGPRSLWTGLVAVPGVLAVGIAGYAALASAPDAPVEAAWKAVRLIGGTALFFALMVSLRRPINARPRR